MLWGAGSALRPVAPIPALCTPPDPRGQPPPLAIPAHSPVVHFPLMQAPPAAAGQFGFPVDSWIGGTPQANDWMPDWPAFFEHRRLRPQLALAGRAELDGLAEPVLRGLGGLFQGLPDLTPALLHGDLWSGNVLGTAGAPALLDPACYYGHAEAEFGMAWCAGFGAAFWEAYHARLPRRPGFGARLALYELYHKLVSFSVVACSCMWRRTGQSLAGTARSAGCTLSGGTFLKRGAPPPRCTTPTSSPHAEPLQPVWGCLPCRLQDPAPAAAE